MRSPSYKNTLSLSLIAEAHTANVKTEVLSPLLSSEPVRSESPCPNVLPSPCAGRGKKRGITEERASSYDNGSSRRTSPFSARVSKPPHYRRRSPSIPWSPRSEGDESLVETHIVHTFNKRAVVTNPNKKHFKATSITKHRLENGKLEYLVTWEPCWISERIYTSNVRIVKEQDCGNQEDTGRLWYASKVLDTYNKGRYKAYYMEWLPRWLQSTNVGDGLLYDYLEKMRLGFDGQINHT
ncbi:hypothetical protein TWF281_007848 [Arthrobotrys megalospora]